MEYFQFGLGASSSQMLLALCKTDNEVCSFKALVGG